ncbi:SGNH/GDSL hydrolase family protein [Streptomyces sp. 4N509B]|uniref:SGNH/GDSL hydrolase family protein n=1 Tax=Streptomyces sp. 4N509B TaxID=3457413 RepID=UPI003FCFCC7C
MIVFTRRRRPRLTLRATLAGLVGVLLCALLATPALTASPQDAPAASSASLSARGDATWVGTWSTTVTSRPASDTTAFEDQTIRQVVHTSVGGTAARVRLSNEFGTTPLVIGEARVALRDPDAPDSARTQPGTDRRLTFGGASSLTIPAGAPAVSDPVDLRVPAGADLVISLYLPEHTPGTTLHAFAFQNAYVADGNVTAERDVEATATTDRWYFLSGVSVQPRHQGHGHDAAAVVALGDSITDGSSITPGSNRRWPDVFAERLRQAPGTAGIGVLNQGVSGNRVLHDPNPPAGHAGEAYAAYFGPNALSRFDRDVASQPGVEHVVVLLGVNDLGHPGNGAPESERVSAEEIITGHEQLIARAHERGLRIYGGTITPFEGDTLGFHSPENEAARQQINDWIRTSGAYDGVIDFDAAVRDPAHPERLLPAYDSGDHLHPNEAGLAAMARAVPLRLFR